MLDPNTQVSANAYVDAWVNEFWRQCEKRLSSRLSPYQIDRTTGQVSLEHHKLLNFNPSAYFQRPIPWTAPARFNCYAFMSRYGLGDLAPYTERIRLTTNGKVNVKSASRLWFQLFGLEYDFACPQAPLRRTNRIRPQEITNPELEQFLEHIG